MKKNSKRFLSLILAICMLVPIAPASFASPESIPNQEPQPKSYYYNMLKALDTAQTDVYDHYYLSTITYDHTTQGGASELNPYDPEKPNTQSDPWAYHSRIPETLEGNTYIKFIESLTDWGLMINTRSTAESTWCKLSIKVKVDAAGAYQPYAKIYHAAAGVPMEITISDTAGNALATMDYTTVDPTGSARDVNIGNQTLSLDAGEYIFSIRMKAADKTICLHGFGLNLIDTEPEPEPEPKNYYYNMFKARDTAQPDVYGYDYITTITYDHTTQGGASELNLYDPENPNTQSDPWAFHSRNTAEAYTGNRYIKFFDGLENLGLMINSRERSEANMSSLSIKVKVDAAGNYLPYVKLYHTANNAPLEATFSDLEGNVLSTLTYTVAEAANAAKDVNLGNQMLALEAGEYIFSIRMKEYDKTLYLYGFGLNLVEEPASFYYNILKARDTAQPDVYGYNYLPTITYDHTTQGGASELNPYDPDDPNTQSDPWAFYSRIPEAESEHAGNTYIKFFDGLPQLGLMIDTRSNVEANWCKLSVKVKLDAAGDYLPYVKLYHTTSGGPMEASFSDLEGNVLSRIDYNSYDTTNDARDVNIGKQRLTLEAGEYIFSVRMKGAQKRICLYGFGLSAKEPDPDPVTLSVSAPGIASVEENSTVDVPLAISRSDEKAVDYSQASVDVQYSAADIATVAPKITEDGIVLQITGVQEGSTQVTATVNIGELSASAAFTVTVSKSVNPEDKRNTTKRHIYDFLSAKPENLTQNTKIYDTNQDWYISDLEGAAPWKAIEDDPYVLWIPNSNYGAFMQSDGLATHTFMIQVPEAGEYDCWLENWRMENSYWCRIMLQPCDATGAPTGEEFSLKGMDLSSEEPITEETYFGAARLNEGYYLLKFETNRFSKDKKKIFVNKFILQGVSLKPSAQLPLNAAIAVGETLEVPLTAALNIGLEDSKVGTLECLSVSSDNKDVLTVSQGENQTLKITGVAEGSATISISARDENYEGRGTNTIRVVPAGSFAAEGDSSVSMPMGESAVAKFTGTLLGESIDMTGVFVTAQVQDPAVCSVESSGGPDGLDVKVTGTKIGNTVVKLRIGLSNQLAVEREVAVSVTQGLLKVEMDDIRVPLGESNRGTIHIIDGGQPAGATGFQITAVAANPAIADAQVVIENGEAVLTLEGLSGGETTVTIQVSDGKRSAQCTMTAIVARGKTSSSFYTPEKLAAARENVQKYSWARETRDTAVAAADEYIGKEEWLWNLVTTQELPRGAAVGYRWDPDMYTCRFCEKNLQVEYGNYPWLFNVETDPWKVQCPDCRRRFPSNDFGSFYKLGIDEKGNFNYELAKQKNQELVDAGQDGYLKNILHPDADVKFGVENWGVDDGYGYKTGKVYDTGSTIAKQMEESHTYIAYYNHWAIWHTLTIPAAIPDALNKLREAYLYTGDKQYGRVGAILVDRIADVYPDMYIRPYFPNFFNSDSTTPKGKMIGCIWQHGLDRNIVLSYDAFYDMYDDPTVIRFLSNKASQYELRNEKDTARKIRDNVEDGYLREVRKGIEYGNIHGNFGMHQSLMAYTAVVLDSVPESGEMIDWVFRSGNDSFFSDDVYIDGGNVQANIINSISRDGMGQEAAPNYNLTWIGNLGSIATALAGYETYPAMDLYKNPRYFKMFSAVAPLTLCRRATAQIGDSGATADETLMLPGMTTAYLNNPDPELAQLIYLQNGNSVNNLHADIFTKDPEGIQEMIREDIETYGEYDLDRSQMLADFGFAILRGGSLYDTVSGYSDTQRDFWMYFGQGVGHGHPAALNLGIHAYGLDLAPDLGYPEAADGAPKNVYWGQATVNHNTVMVGDARQSGLAKGANGNIMHMDDSGRVKVMDVDTPQVYGATSIFRRTVVMVEASDEVSYGIDFFRVKGGSNHLYSFHSLSDQIFETSDNLDFVAQDGGTYAGADVPMGPNNGRTNGYDYLYNVRRAADPGQEFSVDFKVKDFRKTLKQERDLHLRMTMLNDFDMSEVAIATGQPPQRDNNPASLEFVLAKRNGSNLDTLFTTVFEPYDGERYIESQEQVDVVRTGGAEEGANDAAKAVKVTLKSGRVDYIVYATNNQVTYRVDDAFDFRGFVGVYSVADGKEVYSYLNDGEQLGELTGLPAYTGTVTDFTKDYTMENYITVTADQAVDVQRLIDQYIYVDNGQANYNGAYQILDAEDLGGNQIRLHLGNTSLIRVCKDAYDLDAGYVYNIAEGQSFRIPLSAVSDASPVFAPVSEQRATVGSRYSLTLRAETPDGSEVTYAGQTLPRGAQIDETSGTIIWTPDGNQVGKHHVAIKAISGVLETVLHFEIEVFKSSTTNGGSSNNNQGNNNQGNDNQGDNNQGNDNQGENQGDNNQSGDSPRFIDLGGYEWAKESINGLAEKGIVKGTSANTYSPGKNITRADFAILLTRAFGLTNAAGENFADVDAGAYYAKELAIAKAAGIVQGVGNNRFHPEGEISREDMMVMLARALDTAGRELAQADAAALAAYSDAAQISDYAKEAVSRLVKEGIVAGDQGRIHPQGRATRAEVAVILARIFLVATEE